MWWVGKVICVAMVLAAAEATVGIPSNYSVCVWSVLSINNVTQLATCSGNITYTVNRTAGEVCAFVSRVFLVFFLAFVSVGLNGKEGTL